MAAENYWFLSMGPEGDQEGFLPILAIRDKTDRFVFARMVPQKDVDEWAVRQITNHVLSLGYPSVRLSSDGGLAVQALLLQT